MRGWAVGKEHQFDIKTVSNVRWRSAGADKDLTLIVIRPLGYRLIKGSRTLYREPAYLILTNPDMPIEQALHAYLWRWEIEVNFREEKTLLGCGQGQVRNIESAEKLPAFIVLLYGLLHVAWIRAHKNGEAELLPRTKWYKRKDEDRVTTGDLINIVRAQLWSQATKPNFSGFVNENQLLRSQRNLDHINASAAFYVRN